jgi:succinate dehydrogenase / fumarate reductase, iron-sulfur subunit
MSQLSFSLAIWRQESPQTPGGLVDYQIAHVSPDISFLEMLDLLNAQLLEFGERPIQFDSDCREGICGSCGVAINGQPQGGACQLYMRQFVNRSRIVVEPFRAAAFPVLVDLVVDRSAFDRLMQAGGYVSVNTGNAPEANSIPIPQAAAEHAFDLATCIGCGACVAACPNSAAVLFVGAKVAQYGQLPQGRVEQSRRVQQMTGAMDGEGFGSCSNHGHCAAVCPQEISLQAIATLRQEYWRALGGK